MRKDIFETAVEEFDEFKNSFFVILQFLIVIFFLFIVIDKIFGTVSCGKLFCWDGSFGWEAIVLFITAVFISAQSKSTKELVSVTLQPKISVGLMYSEKDTILMLSSMSSFTVWLWTDLKFKKDNEYIKIKDAFLLGDEPWELEPYDILPIKLGYGHPELIFTEEEISKITIEIKIFYSISNKKKPGADDWITLTPYHFDKEQNDWIKSGMGVRYNKSFLERRKIL